MRISRRLPAVLSLALALAACTETDNPIQPRSSGDPLMQRVAELGFDTTGAFRAGNQIIVEGDIGLRIDRIMDTSPGAAIAPPDQPSYQWMTDVIVGQPNTWGIALNLSALPEGTWKTAARAAITEWNNAQSGINMFEVGATTPNEIVVIIAYNYFPACTPQGNTAGQGDFPVYSSDPGSAGDTVRINPDWGNPNCLGTLTASGAKRTMAHEIGHTLGLRHTNWQARNEPLGEGANQVPGTPATDGNSVMDGGEAGYPWPGWSPYDLVAIRTMYPKVADVRINWDSPIDLLVGEASYIAPFNAYTAAGKKISGKIGKSWTHSSLAFSVIYTGEIFPNYAGSGWVRAETDGVRDSTRVRVHDIQIVGPDSLPTGGGAWYSVTISGPNTPYSVWRWSLDTPFTPKCYGQTSCYFTAAELQGSLMRIQVDETPHIGYYLNKTKSVVVY